MNGATVPMDNPVFSRGSQCSMKRQYEKADAKRTAKVQSANRKGGNVHAYRCIYCDWWHLGLAPANHKNLGKNYERGLS